MTRGAIAVAAYPGPVTETTPTLPGEGPVLRTAARVLMVDADGRTLLFRGFDPAVGPQVGWWFTPGGGLELGEGLRVGAVREVAEETGHAVAVDDLHELGLVRENRFTFLDRLIVQTEHWFCVRALVDHVDSAGFEPLEVATVTGHRWWTRGDLLTTSETVFPPDLVDLLDRAAERLGSSA